MRFIDWGSDVCSSDLWVFEDERPDERLVLLAVELLSKTGRNGDAEAHLWRAFKQAPSLQLSARLREHGGEQARQRAVQLLEARQIGRASGGERMCMDVWI